MLIGVVSDTHGLYDARLGPALTGVELILHAGDVGSLEVLARLGEMAPVVAVRGNNDDKVGGLGLPLTEDIEAGGAGIHLVHQLRHATPAEGCRVVIFGHSHKPLLEWRERVLHLNPGAAGRVGFHRSRTLALLRIEGRTLDARIVDMDGALKQAFQSKQGWVMTFPSEEHIE